VGRGLRWPFVFLLIAGMLVVLLSLGGWRLVEQERTLARQRTRERLENAASLVVRESERALQHAGNDGNGLEVVWDGGGLRRTAGTPLLWSPAPAMPPDAPASVFTAGERLEFGGAEPGRALVEYRALLTSASREIRAGALLRIARCQRKLARAAEALETYAQLLSLGEIPAGGAPAALVALRERAVLLEAEGKTAESQQERARLLGVLEQGRYSIDSATFAFYAGSQTVDESARNRAQAVEQLWRRAADFARGTETVSVEGRRYLVEWSRVGDRGTGRVVEMDSIERTLAEVLRASGVRWQLVDTNGARLAGAPTTPAGLPKRAAETGLPWGVRVDVPDASRESTVSLLVGGLVVALGLSILATLYLAFRMVQRQLEVARLQSEFVADVSHEFRTPITALIHLTEMLEAGRAAEERKPAYYTALGRETRRLRELVENLLDFGRIESGRYKYRPERLELREFVRGLVEEFRDEPAAASHDVVFEPDGDELAVSADRDVLRRAVWNLLENATKYSPPGKRVTAAVHAVDECAAVSVTDEGPGVPSDEQKAIFQKFVRGRTAREGRVQGTGIGLALADAIARAHGGRMELQSRPGRGSRFTLLLPREVKP
jgi:signal transduction histidine kinase